MTRPTESHEQREADGVDSGGAGASGPRAHDAAKISGGDAAADHQARVRVSYDAVADAYVERVHNELRHKPLDRALLTAFAEHVQDGFGRGASVCDAGCGPGHVSAFLATLGLTVTGIDLSPAIIEVQTNRAYVLAACERRGPAVSARGPQKLDFGAWDSIPSAPHMDETPRLTRRRWLDWGRNRSDRASCPA
jgi:SAM-dependent methyltransferase